MSPQDLEARIKEYKWEWEQACERVGHRDDRIKELEEKLSVAVTAIKGEILILETAGHKGSALGLKLALKKIEGEK